MALALSRSALSLYGAANYYDIFSSGNHWSFTTDLLMTYLIEALRNSTYSRVELLVRSKYVPPLVEFTAEALMKARIFPSAAKNFQSNPPN